MTPNFPYFTILEIQVMMDKAALINRALIEHHCIRTANNPRPMLPPPTPAPFGRRPNIYHEATDCGR